MKKYICYLFLPILFILYTLLYINIDFKNIIDKKNVSNFIDNIKINNLIKEKEYINLYNNDIIVQNIVKDSILSLIDNNNHVYSEKELLDLIDENIPNTIEIESKEYEIFRSNIYKESSKLLESIPNKNSISASEINLIKNIKFVFSDDYKRILILITVFILGIMMSLSFKELLFLKYNSIAILCITILSIVFKGSIYYICYYFRNEETYGNLLKQILNYITNNMLVSSIVLFMIGIIQLLLYTIFHKNKTE